VVGDDVELVVLDPVPHPAVGHTPAQTIDDETVFTVLSSIVESGGSIAQAAREFGFSPDTIARWLHKHKETMQVVNEAERQCVSALLLQRGKELLGGLDKDKIAKAGARDLAIAAGIMVDKWKDLAGPASGPGALSLKIAWKDGTGAVELKTGGQE